MRNLPLSALLLSTLVAASARATAVSLFIAPTITARDELPGVGAFNTTWTGFGAHRTHALAKFAKTKAADAGAIVFVGDSITEGWHLPAAFPSLKTANRGISGDTSRGILGRIKDNVLDLKPKGVVLLCGINDLNQPGGTPETIAANVKSIIEAIRTNDKEVPILVPEIMPSASRPVEAIRTTNALVDKIVVNLPNVHRIRAFNPMADEQGHPLPRLFPDGTHPNAAGYAVYQKLLEPALAKAGPQR